MKISPKQFALSPFPDYNRVIQNSMVCANDNTCFRQQWQKSDCAADIPQVNNLPVASAVLCYCYETVLWFIRNTFLNAHK